MDFTKDFFTGAPAKSNPLPADIKCIFIADFFKEDITGGAELTTDAILSKSPVKVHKIRSQNMTVNFVRENTDRYWVLTNFTGIQTEVLVELMANPKVRYSVVEYDFKYCTWRSPFKHFIETNQPCNCATSQHGAFIKALYTKADKIFWMAKKQRDIYLEMWPELNRPDKNVIQTSTFSDETFSKLNLLRTIFADSEERKNKVWAIQMSKSWIKGSNETVKWAQRKNLSAKGLGDLPYDHFLAELAKSYGLIFRPLDSDTCPRVVIEAKLLGLNLELNPHVLHADEPWFTGTIEEAEAYLKSRADHFWVQLPLIEK
jgi:hypothetical protein